MNAITASQPLTGTDSGHGKGFALPEFTNLLPLRKAPGYDIDVLAELAAQMKSDPDPVSDGPDPEENLFVPAGYTYFGQFIDHDLTLDTTSTLVVNKELTNPSKPANDPTNIRSPRFDLDCVYGNGPDDQPYLYEQADGNTPAGQVFAGASMILGAFDLARSPNGRALIGDKRNDENSIVNQIQQVFIKFHNQVVRTLVKNGETSRGTDLFNLARDQVRWAYQTIIMQDYLPRIIQHTTLNAFVSKHDADPKQRDKAYVFYKANQTPDLRANLPREFVVAAYRFGHSMVRTGYRLCGNSPKDGNGFSTRLPIFTPSNDGDLSLLGFDPLPRSHVIDDWGRFFPIQDPLPGSRLTVNLGESAEDTEYDPALRLQFAYKIDPSLTDPLGHLPPKVAKPADVPAGVGPGGPPSLALLNLLRGNRYLIQGGQAFAKLVNGPLDSKYLVTREKLPGDFYRFKQIPEPLRTDTPLWFYVLAEAQRPMVDLWMERGGKVEDGNTVTLSRDDLLGRIDDPDPEQPKFPRQRASCSQLGPVGGLIVAEVFYGLLDSDDRSVVNLGTPFVPIWGGNAPHTFAKLLDFTKLPISAAPNTTPKPA